MRRTALLILLLALVLADIARGQSDEDTSINVSTILANVPVIVSDRTGKHVAGIKPVNCPACDVGHFKSWALRVNLFQGRALGPD